MLLSIGMIVKNEENNYLFDCLNSIQPILEEVDSELIIFDTGSTDNTVEIAQGYTSNVFEIEWRDDFAWARNQTLDKAMGEWFMYVDADEIFTDVSDIISFFNSGEYKKYKSASYRWRNILTDTTFNYFRPVRLYKMEKDIRFVGRIHEAIQHKQPLKNLESIADHYGYYRQGVQGQKNSEEKHKRNVKLLLEMYNENPDDERIIYSLAKDYLAAGDLEKFKKFLDLGIEAIGGDANNVQYHVFTDMLVAYYNAANDDANLIKTAEEYIGKKKITQCIIPVYHYYTGALISAGRYTDAAKAARETLKYFDLNKKGKLDSEVSLYTVFPSEIMDNRTNHVKFLALSSAMCGDFEDAFKYAAEYESEAGENFENTIIEMYVEKYLEQKNANALPPLYGYALKCGVDSDIYSNIVAIIENRLTAEAKPYVAQAMVNESSFANADDDYIRLHRLRAAGHTADYKPHLDYFLKSSKTFSQTYADVLFFAMKWCEDFSGFIENIFITDMSKFNEYLMQTNSNFEDTLVSFMKISDYLSKNPSAKSLRIVSSLCMHTFGNTIEKSENNALKMTLHELALRTSHSYLRKVYRPEIYCESGIVSLPESDAYIFYAGEALARKDENDILGYVRGLRKALQFNPCMSGIVQLCMQSLQY